MKDVGLLAVTLGPGIIILVWVYVKDRYEKEPFSLLLGAFFAGVLSTLPVFFANIAWQNAGFGIEATSALQTAFYAFVSVGATEELAKLLMVLLFFYSRKAFNEPFDGIVYCVAVSMGFACAENILYVYVHSHGMEALWVATLRMFTALPAHAIFAILMGYFVGLSKFRPQRMLFILAGLIVATLFHGAYDFFLFLGNVPGISAGAFLSLYIGIRFSRKAIRLNQEESPFRP